MWLHLVNTASSAIYLESWLNKSFIHAINSEVTSCLPAVTVHISYHSCAFIPKPKKQQNRFIMMRLFHFNPAIWTSTVTQKNRKKKRRKGREKTQNSCHLAVRNRCYLLYLYLNNKIFVFFLMSDAIAMEKESMNVVAVITINIKKKILIITFLFEFDSVCSIVAVSVEIWNYYELALLWLQQCCTNKICNFVYNVVKTVKKKFHSNDCPTTWQLIHFCCSGVQALDTVSVLCVIFNDSTNEMKRNVNVILWISSGKMNMKMNICGALNCPP